MSTKYDHSHPKHSRRFVEMALGTARWQILAPPDGYAKNTGVCGDTVEIFLLLQADRIKSVCFRINGCQSTNACANTVATMAEEKSVAEAWQITPEAVIDFLQTLPEEKHHCAELVVGAFYKALADASIQRRKAWQKYYRPRLK